MDSLVYRKAYQFAIRAVFRAKMSIAYKESLETQYWLSLLKDTGYINQPAFESIQQDLVEISKMLCSIVKNI